MSAANVHGALGDVHPGLRVPGVALERRYGRLRPGIHWVPWLAGAVGAAWALVLLLRRADGLASPAYDLGFFQQVIWSIGGDSPWTSSFHRGSFLGLHFSPILAVPAAIERVVGPDARLLSAIHALTLGAVAPAAFLALRAALRPSRLAVPVAAGLTAPIPVWAAMQEALRADFHPEAIGVVFALVAIWAGLSGHRALLWSAAIAALACREDLGYAAMVAGLVVAVRGPARLRPHGRLLALAAVAWTAVVFLVLMPAFRAGAVVDTARYYAWLGSAADLEALAAQVSARLTRLDGWFVAAGMLASVVMLPVVRPRWLVLLVPPLLATLLSAHSPQAVLRFQYPLILFVPMLAATAFGARRVLAVAHLTARRTRGHRPVRSRAARAGLFVALSLPALGVAIAQGSVPPFDPEAGRAFDRPQGLAALREVAAVIPPDALVIADDGLVAPLAARPAVRPISAALPRGAWVVIERDPWAPNSIARERRDRVVARLEADRRPLVRDDGRFRLWGPRPPGGAT